ncbi:MAG TPA: cyclic nucleotide-binding domain-containing protein [Caulobacteraceae bacterium]|nr:cyclic nucleotide-binding domain-containing protein [Caulobacteraceae bacterium]
MQGPELDLEHLPLLSGLPSARRKDLLANAVVHAVAPGTILFDQGEMPTFQHAVLTGSAHLLGRSSEGREVLIEVVEPPDLVIPAAVVTGSPYLMRARIAEPSRLLLIRAGVFRQAVQTEPQLAQAVIASLAGQFRRLVRQVKNLKLRTAAERTGCYLVALSRRQGTPHRAVLPYEKNLIASELGMTRESFSRALSALRVHGVTVQGDTILIRDSNLLGRACHLDPLIDGLEMPP